MIIIKFFTSFGTNAGCIEAYTRVSELNKDPLFNKTYRFTTGEDYTHAIILNTAMPKLTIPPKNVIGLAFEPLEFLGLTHAFVEYAQESIGQYLIGQKSILPLPFTEQFGYMWHITPLDPAEVVVQKKNIMSLMVSDKTILPGHKYRHLICKHILHSNLPIDIYGRGCKFYSNIKDPRLKGVFSAIEPYNDYQFHIAIENTQTPHYFSEKIMDPLLCNTLPVYLGCQNIKNYFPDSVIQLSGDIQDDMTLLTDICRNREKYSKQVDIEAVKKTISFSNVVNLFVVGGAALNP